MPFDPALPLENTEIDAAQMRAQLNALKALVDAGVPGPAGPPGPPGVDGTNGTDGTNGADGEVTFAALVLERINHASNPLSVPVLGLVVSDPPTQAEVQAVVSKLDALITALRREV